MGKGGEAWPDLNDQRRRALEQKGVVCRQVGPIAGQMFKSVFPLQFAPDNLTVAGGFSFRTPTAPIRLPHQRDTANRSRLPAHFSRDRAQPVRLPDVSRGSLEPMAAAPATLAWPVASRRSRAPTPRARLAGATYSSLSHALRPPGWSVQVKARYATPIGRQSPDPLRAAFRHGSPRVGQRVRPPRRDRPSAMGGRVAARAVTSRTFQGPGWRRRTHHRLHAPSRSRAWRLPPRVGPFSSP